MSTYPVGKLEPFFIIFWKTSTDCAPVISPAATLQSTKEASQIEKHMDLEFKLPKESNLPPSGVAVHSTGTKPIAREIARTRSSEENGFSRCTIA